MIDNLQTEFYSKFFVDDPIWNTPYPNHDEATRAGAILPLVSEIRQRSEGSSFRILDVGCGRGWLANILSCYGEVIGVDPVPDVIAYARSLYPSISFMVSTPDDFLASGQDAKFDVVVASEVIEHIPSEGKDSFVLTLKSFLKTDGRIILTTPRGELFRSWSKLNPRQQPIEAWLTEREMIMLSKRCNLTIESHHWCAYRYVYPNVMHKWVRIIATKLLEVVGIRAVQLRQEPMYQIVTLAAE